jgi:hypothetical protein
MDLLIATDHETSGFAQTDRLLQDLQPEQRENSRDLAIIS